MSEEKSVLRLKTAIRVTRAPFFTAVIVPTLLGAVLAWHDEAAFHVGYFLLAFMGAVSINAGFDMSNPEIHPDPPAAIDSAKALPVRREKRWSC